MNTRNALVAASLAAAALAAGCASSGTSLGQYKDVLSYPDRLEPVPNQPGAYRWLAPTADLRQYNKVLLDRIHVKLADDAENKSIDPVQMGALVEYFRQSIVKALGDQYPVVAEKGPDVLRVRITIVDVVPNDVAVSAGVTAIAGPIATVMVSEVSGVPAGAAPYLGRTGIAAEFINSMTNEVIGEYADTKYGQQYNLDTSGGVSGMVSQNATAFGDSLTKWAYVHQAFDHWAALFRQRLDQAHGIAPPKS